MRINLKSSYNRFLDYSAGIIHPKLNRACKTSQKVLSESSQLFKSSTLNELYKDDFKSSSNIGIINAETTQKADTFVRSHIGKFVEIYYLKRLDNKKHVRLANIDLGIFKKDGYVEIALLQSLTRNTVSGVNPYKGAGVRLIQLSAERAAKENLNKVIVDAEPKAVPFYTMMGFVPAKNKLNRIKKISEINRYADIYKGIFSQKNSKISVKSVTPIVIKENGRFYVDETGTYTNAILREIKRQVQDKAYILTTEFNAPSDLRLELKGENFQKWLDRAKEQPILK